MFEGEMDAVNSSINDPLRGNISSNLADAQLHPVVQWFLVLLYLILIVVALIGNVFLGILVCLMKKRINSTAMYLLFLVILNFLLIPNSFMKMTALATRRWPYGDVFCSISVLTAVFQYISLPGIHICLSIDLLLFLLRPLKYSRPRYWALFFSIFNCLLSLLICILIATLHRYDILAYWLTPDGQGFSLCYYFNTPQNAQPLERIKGYLLVTTPVCLGLFGNFLTLAVYSAAACKLYSIKRKRRLIRMQPAKGNLIAAVFDNDPIDLKRESRTVYSLLGAFLLQISSISIQFLAALVASRNVPFWLYLVLDPFFLITPQVPLLLVLINKVFRKRLKTILSCKCEIEAVKESGTRKITTATNSSLSSSVDGFSEYLAKLNTTSGRNQNSSEERSSARLQRIFRDSQCNRVSPQLVDMNEERGEDP